MCFVFKINQCSICYFFTVDDFLESLFGCKPIILAVIFDLDIFIFDIWDFWILKMYEHGHLKRFYVFILSFLCWPYWMVNGQNFDNLDCLKISILKLLLINAPNEMFYHLRNSHVFRIESPPILVQNHSKTLFWQPSWISKCSPMP